MFPPRTWFSKAIEKKISRRSFFKAAFFGLAALLLSDRLSRFAFSGAPTSTGRKKRGLKGDYDLVLSRGEDPFRMTVVAITAMGGMQRFVAKNSTVVIKPNIGWDRAPEYAATTNPQVVAALVELCFKAGAKRVNVFDRTCNAEASCYQSSGIKQAAEERGAKVYFVDDWNYVKAAFSYPSSMEGWPIYRDALECDTFINVPIAKHHSLSGLTLSMKNLMGVCGGKRGMMHFNIGSKLVDVTDFINPDLTVIDAFRVLTKHGPSGGSLDDVITPKSLIVSTDATLADIYACRLLNKDPLSVSNIAEAAKRKFGISDVANARIFEITA